MSKHQLTKQESTDTKKLIDLITDQEQIAMALRLQLRAYLAGSVFPRLKLNPEEASSAIVDPISGIVEIPDKKEKKEVSKKQ